MSINSVAGLKTVLKATHKVYIRHQGMDVPVIKSAFTAAVLDMPDDTVINAEFGDDLNLYL